MHLVFSKRSHFGEIDHALLAQRAQARSHPESIDLTQSLVTQVGLELPQWTALFASATDPQETGTPYQAHPRGLRSARLRLCDHYRQRATLKPNHCLLTASTSEAYSMALHVLCDPGDAILVPEPSYPLFEQLAQLAGVRLLRYSIAYDGAWHLDSNTLMTASRLEAEKVRAVVSVSPNNPTGNVLSHTEFAALQSLRLPLIIDEVFRPYLHSDEARRQLCEPFSNKVSPLLLVLDGLSKRAAAPGLKLGWILAQGSDADAFMERLESVSDTFLSVSQQVQENLGLVLAREASIQQSVQQRLSDNLDLLRSQLEGSPVSLLPLQAGWTALLHFPSSLDEQEWARRISEAGVLLQAGSLYALPLAPCFALSLLTPGAQLKAGIERLLQLVEQNA